MNTLSNRVEHIRGAHAIVAPWGAPEPGPLWPATLSQGSFLGTGACRLQARSSGNLLRRFPIAGLSQPMNPISST